MKIKNNKGLTLMELIIAIALVTVVLGIGYKVFDKVQVLPGKQASNSDIQNGMNRVRDFMSKELKYCKSVKLEYKKGNGVIVQDINSALPTTENELEKAQKFILDEISKKNKYKYQYNIVNNHSNNSSEEDKNQVEYLVETYSKNNEKYFSVSKVDNEGVKMDMIYEQKYDYGKLPIIVTYKEGMYSIGVNYDNSGNKCYKFEVFNGSYTSGDSDIVDPGEGDEIAVDGYLLYCLQAASESLEKSLSKNSIYNNYEDLIEAKDEINKIIQDKKIEIKYIEEIIEEVQEEIEDMSEKGHFKQEIHGENFSAGELACKSEIYLIIAKYVVNHIENECDYAIDIFNTTTKINQSLHEYALYLNSLYYRNNQVNTNGIGNLQNQILYIKNEINALNNKLDGHKINNIIDEMVNLELGTIALFRKPSYIDKYNDLLKMKSINENIRLLLKLKCQWGDVNYYKNDI